MGRIKTKLVKRATNELLSKNRDKFSSNFKENKDILAKLMSVDSKKIRNMIAGYISRLVKKSQL